MISFMIFSILHAIYFRILTAHKNNLIYSEFSYHLSTSEQRMIDDVITDLNSTSLRTNSCVLVQIDIDQILFLLRILL